MKLVSWNVNGLRALYKKGGWQWLLDNQPDIFCVQETKARFEQLPEEVKSSQGYFSYFDHAKLKKGYSGVATYLKSKFKNQISKIEYGLGIDKLDQEGRLIAIYLEDFVLINCYFPNGGGGPERLKFKLDYYEAFLNYLEKVEKTHPNIVFCGDINTAHKEVDLARPKENENNTGFLPVERAWIDKVTSKGFIDTFRYFHGNEKGAYTYWDMKTFARDHNVGWRIDYFFVSKNLKKVLTNSKIYVGVLGSDHCPISLEIS